MEYRFKVVLLGEGAVGKSSLLLRFVENKFSPKHQSTVQASFLSKTIHVEDSQVDLNIWDTAGQEKYHALGPIYYRGSHGALLIYDITDENSFKKVKVWVKELQRTLGNSAVLYIVGNKLDLSSTRVVSVEDAETYAESVGAVYNETSAKENLGVEAVFESICRDMIEAARELSAQQVQDVGRRTIQLIDDPPRSGGKCCK